MVSGAPAGSWTLATAQRRRSASTIASSRVVWGMTIANSSPPIRARTSVARHAPRPRPAGRRPAGLAQALRDAGQRGVAGGVPEAGVERLEPVDVADHERERP